MTDPTYLTDEEINVLLQNSNALKPEYLHTLHAEDVKRQYLAYLKSDYRKDKFTWQSKNMEEFSEKMISVEDRLADIHHADFSNFADLYDKDVDIKNLIWEEPEED